MVPKMRIIDGNSEEYIDMQLIGSLAKAVVSKPADTDAWIEMTINPSPSLKKRSSEFEAACRCYSRIDGNTTLEEMAEWAFLLLTRDDNYERHAGYHLRWAVQNYLMEKWRSKKLTQKEQDLLQKVSR